MLSRTLLHFFFPFWHWVPYGNAFRKLSTLSWVCLVLPGWSWEDECSNCCRLTALILEMMRWVEAKHSTKSFPNPVMIGVKNYSKVKINHLRIFGSVHSFVNRTPWCIFQLRSETTQTSTRPSTMQPMWASCSEERTMHYSLIGQFLLIFYI